MHKSFIANKNTMFQPRVKTDINKYCNFELTASWRITLMGTKKAIRNDGYLPYFLNVAHDIAEDITIIKSDLDIKVSNISQ